MPKVRTQCAWCEKELFYWPSVIKEKNYCNYSCQIKYRNKHDNPSWKRDLSGEKNPMYGKGYKIAGEKNPMYGKKSELCPNWKGGRSVRKDGYVRVNVDGKRVLEHRHILEQEGVDLENKVVHHKDGNPNNNSLDNLQVFDSQSEHISIGHARRFTP